EAVGPRLLGGGASLQSRRRLCELHGCRRGRRPDRGDLRAELQAASGCEAQIRPAEPLSGQPEHPACLTMLPERVRPAPGLPQFFISPNAFPALCSRPRGGNGMADIVLINPRFTESYWGLEHALPLMGKKANLPPAGLLLLAGLTPAE